MYHPGDVNDIRRDRADSDDGVPSGPGGDEPKPADDPDAGALSGMANVAALTFLAARAVPLGWVVGVVGGVPLARAAQRHGARAGYGTAIASLVETMAIMGPARMGIPVPHAISAPLLGSLERRGHSLATLALAGAAARTVYYVATSALSIVLLIGLDAYLGSYERLRETFGFLPSGRAAALWLTLAFVVAWSSGAGLVQAWVIRRGLRRWPTGGAATEQVPSPEPSAPAHRFSGVLVLLAIAGFVATLASTDPRSLLAIGVVLTIAWTLTAAGWLALARGLLLALPLAVSTLLFGLVGGIGADLAARRGARVALLVLIAVWVHRAAGAQGLRVQSMRLVHRLRRSPTLALAGTILAASVSAEDFGGAARRLGARLRVVVRRPVPVLDASLAWLADESVRLAAPKAEGASPPDVRE